MSKENLDLVRAGFIRHKHGRFLEEFFSDGPFGRAADYEKCVEKASVEQLARLIKACGFLLQEKAYLVWPQNHDHSTSEEHPNALWVYKVSDSPKFAD